MTPNAPPVCGNPRCVKGLIPCYINGEIVRYGDCPTCTPPAARLADWLPLRSAHNASGVTDGEYAHDCRCQPSPTKAKPEGRSDANAVRRYDIYMHSDDVQFLRECPDGDYVRFADHTALLAERDALLSQRDAMVIAYAFNTAIGKVAIEQLAILTSANEALQTRWQNEHDLHKQNVYGYQEQLAALQLREKRRRELLQQYLPRFDQTRYFNTDGRHAYERTISEVRAKCDVIGESSYYTVVEPDETLGYVIKVGGQQPREWALHELQERLAREYEQWQAHLATGGDK